jgi:hypothetical protein
VREATAGRTKMWEGCVTVSTIGEEEPRPSQGISSSFIYSSHFSTNKFTILVPRRVTRIKLF